MSLKTSKQTVKYLIELPMEVAKKIAGRGAANTPLRSRKRQTEHELCAAEGVNLDSIIPLKRKGAKKRKRA